MSLQTFFVTGEIDKITNFEVINPHVGIRRSDENEVCGHITIINIYSVNLYYLSFISLLKYSPHACSDDYSHSSSCWWRVIIRTQLY